MTGPGEIPVLRERPATIALVHRYVHGDALIKQCLATGAIIKKRVSGFLLKDPAH
jgi:hypothetical protein